MVNQFYKLTLQTYRLIENNKGNKFYRHLTDVQLNEVIQDHNMGLFAHRVDIKENGHPDVYFYIGALEAKIPSLCIHKDRIVKDTSEGKVGDLFTTLTGNTYPIVGKFCTNFDIYYVVKLPNGLLTTYVGYEKIEPQYEHELKKVRGVFHNQLMEGFRS